MVKSDSLATQAQRTLSDALRTSPKLARLATAVAVLEAGHQLAQKVRAHAERYVTWQVVVAETDASFRVVQAWLVRNVPESQHRNLVARTVDSDGARAFDVPETPAHGRELEFLINDEVEHWVRIEGHRVKVWVNNPAKTAANDRERVREPMEIKFSARSQDGQHAVRDLLQRLNADRTARKPALRMVTSWGSWQWRMDVPQRTLDSVILPVEQKDRIVADLERFLGDESRYTALGAPWHRGFMFHGPPGTGKTSLVKALATHFGLDLWYVPLSDLKDETGLMGLISEVSPRSVLLLEDIDTVRISHDREQDGPGITMSSLLNALDGVATPHGLITFMTTNHFDLLDDALTRAGRMDTIEEIGLPTYREVGGMFEHFYGVDPDIRLPEPHSQAEIAEVFKRHMTDYQGAVDELTGLQGRAALPGRGDDLGQGARHARVPPLPESEVSSRLP